MKSLTEKKPKKKVNLTHIAKDNKETLKVHEGDTYYKTQVFQKDVSDNTTLPKEVLFSLPIKWQNYFYNLAAAKKIPKRRALEYFLDSEEVKAKENLEQYKQRPKKDSQSIRLHKSISRVLNGDTKLAASKIKTLRGDLCELIEKSIQLGKREREERKAREINEATG